VRTLREKLIEKLDRSKPFADGELVANPACRRPTFDIFIETENLAGSHDFSRLRYCLDSIKNQTLSPEESATVSLLCSEEDEARAKAILEDYSWIGLCVYEKPGLNLPTCYYYCKAKASEVSQADIIVFLDSDCVYESKTVEALVEAFQTYPELNVATGQAQVARNSVYGMAMHLSFVFPQWVEYFEIFQYPGRGYIANCVAFRREVLRANPIVYELPHYRQGCVAHTKALRKAGETIAVISAAKATHPHVDPSEFFSRFFRNGEDQYLYWLRDNDLLDSPLTVKFRVVLSSIVFRLRTLGSKIIRLLLDSPREIGLVSLSIPICACAEVTVFSGILVSFLRQHWGPSTKAWSSQESRLPSS